MLTVPLEALLQPKELSKREIIPELSQLLGSRLLLFAQIDRRCVPAVTRCGWLRLSTGETYLRKHALDLAQSFADLGGVL
jgi:hypothetical protein